MAGHQRSSSLPSMPHHSEINVEEELHNINSVISSPSATIGMVCDGLRRLGDVYNCINEIIYLHSNQVHAKRLEEEMERSLEVLDLCNAMQESFSDLKMIIQELQMALNRGDHAVVHVKVQSYIRLMKKAKHHLKKSGNKSASDENGRPQFIDNSKRDYCLSCQICTGSLVEANGHLQCKQVVSYLQIIQEDSSFMRGSAIAGIRVGHCRPREWNREPVQEIDPNQGFSSEHT